MLVYGCSAAKGGRDEGLGLLLSVLLGDGLCALRKGHPVVVIVGGMGSLKGAVIGSIAVGMLDNFGKALVPELSYFTLFAPMAVILAVRPTGLFGRA